MFFFEVKGKDLDKIVEITTATGIPAERVARLAFLKGLRFVMQGGDSNRIWKIVRKERPISASQLRRGQIDVLVLEHQETKTDFEISQMMDPPVPRSAVTRRRVRLGLLKQRGVRFGVSGVASMFNKDEFESKVLSEGFSITEYIKFKGWNCSRERVRQVAEAAGARHGKEDRAPEWKLYRRARMIGNLNLANREWFAEKLAASISITSLAAELGITDEAAFFFVRNFNLTHPCLRKHGMQTVDLVCARCSSSFKRQQRQVNIYLKRASERFGREVSIDELEFFCGQFCTGKYNKVRYALRKVVQPTSEATQ